MFPNHLICFNLERYPLTTCLAQLRAGVPETTITRQVDDDLLITHQQHGHVDSFMQYIILFNNKYMKWFISCLERVFPARERGFKSLPLRQETPVNLQAFLFPSATSC